LTGRKVFKKGVEELLAVKRGKPGKGDRGDLD